MNKVIHLLKSLNFNKSDFSTENWIIYSINRDNTRYNNLITFKSFKIN